jgi:hypothetical protein
MGRPPGPALGQFELVSVWPGFVEPTSNQEPSCEIVITPVSLYSVFVCHLTPDLIASGIIDMSRFALAQTLRRVDGLH